MWKKIKYEQNVTESTRWETVQQQKNNIKKLQVVMESSQAGRVNPVGDDDEGRTHSSVYLMMMCSFLMELLLYGRLVPGAHEAGRVEPGGLLKVLAAHLGLSLPLSQLRHALGEVLHAGVEVHDDGEVDLGLQAGRGADRHAGALALDAEVCLSHAGHRVPILLLL